MYKQWDKRERGRERRRIPMKPGDPAKKSGSTPFIIITPSLPPFLTIHVNTTVWLAAVLEVYTSLPLFPRERLNLAKQEPK